MADEILTRSCTRCGRDVSFERFTEAPIVCRACGAVHRTEHHCYLDADCEDWLVRDRQRNGVT